MDAQSFNSIKILNSIDENGLMLHLTGRRRDGSLFSITPSLHDVVQKEIINIIKNQVKYYNEQNLKRYNIVGVMDDTVEFANVSDFTNELDKIFNSLKRPVTDKKINPNTYDFFTYELKNKNGVKGGFELSFYGGLKMHDLGGLRINRC